MELDLRTLFDVEASADDGLEMFIGTRLFDARHWASSRELDGIADIRILETSRTRLRLLAKLWDFDGGKHVFGLDLELESDDMIAWVVSFEIAGGETRKRRNLYYLVDHSDEIEWTIRLTGRARAEDEMFRPLKSSAHE